ncbi:dephospho-CoA kinase [Gammaproteobacteria bacterium]|nr:dephospho-CoA kinase [Gammaproteobacteria bacterium]
MLTIGLTGGIGSGKSTVAELFKSKNINIIDTDQIAKDITQINTKAYNEIVKKFGSEVLTTEKNLNRIKLRKLIFTNLSNKIWIEKLLHPIIRNETIKQIKLTKSKYCIIVIPLLIETLPNTLIDRILVVDATEQQQINRAILRDKQSDIDINNIIKNQVTRAERIKFADEVITNTGSTSDLINKVDSLHKFYISKS